MFGIGSLQTGAKNPARNLALCAQFCSTFEVLTLTRAIG
jgi:hypothetical protein